jgi:hypothetical protein
MIDWQLAVGLIAFAVLCGLLWWIETQGEDERMDAPRCDLVVRADDWDAGDGHVRHPRNTPTT